MTIRELCKITTVRKIKSCKDNASKFEHTLSKELAKKKDWCYNKLSFICFIVLYFFYPYP